MSLLNTISLLNGGVQLTQNAYKTVKALSYFDENNYNSDSNKLKNIEFSQKQLKIALEKYPNKVPIIIQKSSSSKLNDLTKNKFLIDKNIKVYEFKYIIQRRINLKYLQAFFLFHDFWLVDNNQTIGELYHKKKDQNGILYLKYCEENAFG